MKKNKIYYICSTYPFPDNNGGEKACVKHINELKDSKFDDSLEFLFFNIAKKTIIKNYNNFCIMNSDYINKSYISKVVSKIYSSLFSKFPHFMYILCDKNKIIEISKYSDLIIFDGIQSTVLLPPKYKNKVIYIAHNIEYDFSLDIANLEKNIFKKIQFMIEALKYKYLEKLIWEKADKIVCISTSDYKVISNKYPNKTVFLPHKIQLQDNKWNGKDEKTLFFCGAMDFPPNYEAIKWIATIFADTLYQDIKIKIAGKGTDSVPEEWKKDNIEFLGFVSKEELFDLYKNSSAFICPIVYGSGVKIKVTEALGFGTPVIATKEALEGLDYIDIKPLIDRSDLQKTKENIEMLLNNQSKLQEYSSNLISQIETYQRKNDNSLEKIIDSLSYKNSDYDIVSLGYDCAVRRYLTMAGLKKTKALGEKSMVFDLSVNPIKSVIKFLNNDFEHYFDGLEYKNNIWINRKHGILYNHDKDCGINDKFKLMSRFSQRIQNFNELMTISNYIFFVIKTTKKITSSEINKLYKILCKKRKNKKFKLIVLDVECRLQNKTFDNNNILILNLHHPFLQSSDWWKPGVIDSDKSIKFQNEICNFIENKISENFIINKYFKEDVNDEFGEY